MATIYILEDDLNIQEIEAYALKNSGYQTEGFDNAREFFKKVSERVPSLLLLDIMLPDADGLDVLRKLRLHAGDKEAADYSGDSQDIRNRQG